MFYKLFFKKKIYSKLQKLHNESISLLDENLELDIKITKHLFKVHKHLELNTPEDKLKINSNGKISFCVSKSYISND